MGYPGYSYGGTGTTELPASGIAKPDQFTPDPYVVEKVNAWRDRAYGPQAGASMHQTASQRGPVTPYQPGTQPPTGNQTYGGQFGTFNPAPVGLSSQEVVAGARGERPVQPGALSDFGNNMGGRFYGGTTPQMVSAPGGGMRPGFMAPPNQQAEGMSAEQKQQFAQDTGNYFNPQTGALEGSNLGLSPMQQRLAGVVGGLPNRVQPPNSPQLAENRQRYLANREKAQQARATGQTPFQQRLAKREAQQETSYQRALGVMHPQLAADMERTKAQERMHGAGLKTQADIESGRQKSAVEIAKGNQDTTRYTADATADQNRLLVEQKLQGLRAEHIQKRVDQGASPEDAAREAEGLYPALPTRIAGGQQTPLSPSVAQSQPSTPLSPAAPQAPSKPSNPYSAILEQNRRAAEKNQATPFTPKPPAAPSSLASAFRPSDPTPGRPITPIDQKKFLEPLKGNPSAVVDYLQSKGFPENEINIALNELYGSTLGQWTRTAGNPHGSAYTYVNRQGKKSRTIIGRGLDLFGLGGPR